ncbi:hypothetical protein A6U86_31015 [Rhizobium sp. AC27/96]|uniref:hypothetical protein n=1 Tax=Rhizobium sp. AC27/96 TaxID=1841653 RepID=UPI00082842CF|nr:hypothetical protein [Rhizobium sp. AC27/96]OCJ03546.1 hypothetical protein A6U86_31015 [Rhizobium sp. AC27/96]
MKKFWDNYGWLIALMVLSLVVLRAFWGREPFCGIKDEQCLREWIGALSGWVGGAAAIITILVINHHHRENIKLQNVPIFRTAQLAKDSSNMLRTICRSLEKSLQQGRMTATMITLKEIHTILTGDIIRDFELKIGSGDTSGLIEAKSITSAVIQAIAELPKPNPNAYLAQRIDDSAIKIGGGSVIRKVSSYADAVDQKAQAYISRYTGA